MTAASTLPDKPTLRAAALARRASLEPRLHAAASARAAAHALSWLGDVQGEVVALFAPIGSEIDTGPLAAGLRAAGARLALPVVVDMKSPLLFRLWQAGVPLVDGAGPGRLTIPVPPESAPLVIPDVLVVPLAAYDPSGHRLGYGGGYYDRTLAALRRAKRIEALGYAFAVQELPCLPAEPHDERLDAVVTDAGIITVTAED
ncbi:5-formyltetrahydrofolate cyclo-ligase [Ancylobacter oerskovii]|uniref:5-formyltetrahydrofolate cyclo-ligase n=1 Tax=Ancylobacter oerskovii TaxID=459519 RepID=A0ABW4YSU9_9HYPH|nr:5-formyltetrahydrofolate cyclo-ligase [Ancylobacter oerskovii]MBS7545216.1 5-formyltetrahydrofolate cyclo-ligase [Ancylobacter oerskovii]